MFVCLWNSSLQLEKLASSSPDLVFKYRGLALKFLSLSEKGETMLIDKTKITIAKYGSTNMLKKKEGGVKHVHSTCRLFQDIIDGVSIRLKNELECRKDSLILELVLFLCSHVFKHLQHSDRTIIKETVLQNKTSTNRLFLQLMYLLSESLTVKLDENECLNLQTVLSLLSDLCSELDGSFHVISLGLIIDVCHFYGQTLESVIKSYLDRKDCANSKSTIFDEMSSSLLDFYNFLSKISTFRLNSLKNGEKKNKKDIQVMLIETKRLKLYVLFNRLRHSSSNQGECDTYEPLSSL